MNLARDAAPYRTLSDHLQERYGARTYRLTLSGGRTCPTRDGTFGPKKGWGGCSFCDQYGSASFHSDLRKEMALDQQLEDAAKGIRVRFRAEKFIAYFQSYTSTHDEIEDFRARYAQAVAYPDVVALAVATRPDCLPDEFIDVLTSFLDRVDVILELGVQSFHDPSLEWYDRGHDAACSREAILRAKKAAAAAQARGARGKLEIVAHMILGSPFEGEAEVAAGAHALNELGIDGVKIHHLHILEKTKLAREYRKQTIALPSLDEYQEIVASFLRHLNPGVVVHRTHATAPRGEEIVAPAWSHMRAYPSQRLRLFMNERGWRQGDLLNAF
jgi:radical SAM protein (TIGR01212 family)